MEKFPPVQQSKKFWKPKVGSIGDEPLGISEVKSKSAKNLLPSPGCFFGSISHVFSLASFIGLNIAVSSYSNNAEVSRPDIGPRSSLPFSWRLARILSFPSLSNIFCAVAYLYMTIWIYNNLEEHLGQFFEGVDYYALAVDVISNFIQVTTLLFHARFKGNVLVKLLKQIQDIHLCFQNHADGFVLPKRIKYISISLVVLILLTSFMYGSLFLYIIFGLTCTYEQDSSITFSFVLQKLGHFSLPIYFQTFVALFILITEVIRQYFIQLAEKVRFLLSRENIIDGGLNSISYRPLHSYQENGDGSVSKSKMAQQIEAYRLTFEKLRSTVETASDYFGGCLLTVCSISVVSITAAIYTIILNQTETEGTILSNAKNSNERRQIVNFFFLLWGFHLYFSFFNLGAVLLCGQRVTDASYGVAKSIQESPMSIVDHDAEFQISLMLNAIHGVPVEISACAITKMSMGFVASAVGNVVTYILVLLQFKSLKT